MTTVDIHAAQTSLSDLIEQAAAGEEILIAREGQPVARLVPVMPKRSGMKRPMGLLAGMGTVPDDFNDPLPDEIIAAFEGR